MKYDFQKGARCVSRTSELILSFLLIIACSGVRADSPDVFKNTFPKIAGIHIAGGIPLEDPAYRERLAKNHLVILGMWKNYSRTDLETGEKLLIPDITADIRQKAGEQGNNGILLLKYHIIAEVTNNLNNAVKADIQEKLFSEDGPGGDWWGRTAAGDNASTFPNTWLTNITRFVGPDANGDTFPEWLMSRDYQAFHSQGAFDGWYIDLFLHKPTKNLDWNGDGVDDSRDDENVRRWYREGYVDALERIRALTPDMFVMGNVNGNPASTEGNLTSPEYKGQVTALYEAAAGLSWSTETWAGWSGMMAHYQSLIQNARHGVAAMGVIGKADDYAFMRYALASCLMDNGYFSYANEANKYDQVMWFDEFDVNLGQAIDAPQVTAWKQGVFMRRFENGLAIVNPKGNGPQTLSIPSGYKRISGDQAPTVNNGQPVDTITLPERDGIILISTTTAAPPPTEDSPPRPPPLDVQ